MKKIVLTVAGMTVNQVKMKIIFNRNKKIIKIQNYYKMI